MDMETDHDVHVQNAAGRTYVNNHDYVDGNLDGNLNSRDRSQELPMRGTLDNVGGLPVLRFPGSIIPSQPLTSFGHPEVIDYLAHKHPLVFPMKQFTWEYHHRRNAQQILPWLYLGPLTAGRPEYIKLNGVTFMVAVRSAAVSRVQPKMLNPFQMPHTAGLEALTIDLETPFDLIRELRRTIATIIDHLARRCSEHDPTRTKEVPAKILIYCESGNEKSPVIVAALLMVIFGFGAFEALHLVHNARFCINVTPSMYRMLYDFHTTLQAERDVLTANIPSPAKDLASLSQIRQSGLKRGLEQEDPSDDLRECTVVPDAGRIGPKRAGIPPFRSIGDPGE